MKSWKMARNINQTEKMTKISNNVRVNDEPQKMLIKAETSKIIEEWQQRG